MNQENSLQSINRTIQILKSFSKEEKELSLSDLHHKLSFSKSSIQRILNTLVSNGFIEKDDQKKTYKLGMELYFLGKLVEENSHLLSIANPFIAQLAEEWGENIYLNIIDNNKRKCIAFKESKHALMTISYYGETSPLYAGASAKVLLAFLPKDIREQYIQDSELNKITDTTIISKNILIKDINKVRESGYSISFGERTKGAFAISAPIFSSTGQIIAGLSLSAPIVRTDEEIINKYILSIKDVANQISNKIRFSV